MRRLHCTTRNSSSRAATAFEETAFEEYRESTTGANGFKQAHLAGLAFIRPLGIERDCGPPVVCRVVPFYFETKERYANCRGVRLWGTRLWNLVVRRDWYFEWQRAQQKFQFRSDHKTFENIEKRNTSVGLWKPEVGAASRVWRLDIR